MANAVLLLRFLGVFAPQKHTVPIAVGISSVPFVPRVSTHTHERETTRNFTSQTFMSPTDDGCTLSNRQTLDAPSAVPGQALFGR